MFRFKQIRVCKAFLPRKNSLRDSTVYRQYRLTLDKIVKVNNPSDVYSKVNRNKIHKSIEYRRVLYYWKYNIRAVYFSLNLLFVWLATKLHSAIPRDLEISVFLFSGDRNQFSPRLSQITGFFLFTVVLASIVMCLRRLLHIFVSSVSL